MSTSIAKLFSPADLAAIESAVSAAESRTSGEIVPYAVERSAVYGAALWRGALFGSLAAVVAASLVHRTVGLWSSPLLWWAMAPSLAGAAVGFFAVRLSTTIERWLADDDRMAERVRLGARDAFLAEEVFDTRDRSGILIYLSLFERRVEIVADAGIHRAVPAGTWNEVADRLARTIGEGRAAAGLVEAISRCGEILEHHRVERRGDDADELGNALRIGEAPDV